MARPVANKQTHTSEGAGTRVHAGKTFWRPKVGDLDDSAVRVDENVVTLDVSMYYLVVMLQRHTIINIYYLHCCRYCHKNTITTTTTTTANIFNFYVILPSFTLRWVHTKWNVAGLFTGCRGPFSSPHQLLPRLFQVFPIEAVIFIKPPAVYK